MKTLQLSTLVLLLTSVFYSCTKDDSSLSTAAASQGKPVKEVVTSGNGKTDVSLAITFSPEIGIKDEEVTVTGTFAEESPVPDCGHLQLEWLVDGEWKEFGEKADVTDANHEVSYTFTPTLVGNDVYKFRLHYVASGGKEGKCDFNQEQSDEFALDVIEPCTIQKFGIEGKAVGVPVPGEDGMYAITVTYTISTPEAMENVYFQGGATSGGQDKHALEVTSLTGGLKVLHNNKQNTVFIWEGGSLSDCDKKELSFTYKRRFNCPKDANSAVTGEWTLTGGGLTEPFVVDPVTFDCVSIPVVK